MTFTRCKMFCNQLKKKHIDLSLKVTNFIEIKKMCIISSELLWNDFCKALVILVLSIKFKYVKNHVADFMLCLGNKT